MLWVCAFDSLTMTEEKRKAKLGARLVTSFLNLIHRYQNADAGSALLSFTGSVGFVAQVL